MLRAGLRLAPCQGQASLLDYAVCLGAGKMHHPVHAEKGAKSHCNYIGLKEVRGLMGVKISFSHY